MERAMGVADTDNFVASLPIRFKASRCTGVVVGGGEGSTARTLDCQVMKELNNTKSKHLQHLIL